MAEPPRAEVRVPMATQATCSKRGLRCGSGKTAAQRAQRAQLHGAQEEGPLRDTQPRRCQSHSMAMHGALRHGRAGPHAKAVHAGVR